jgi:hypothetical protein
MYYNNIPKILTDEEIFNKNIKVHIIPPLNLKIKLTNDYIYKRNEFVNLLEYVCNKYNIKIHNNNCYFEDYMPDSIYYKDSVKV